jgi:uncharacterized membrane protein
MVNGMHPKEFQNHLDEEKIVGAIRQAERSSSGEIRVFISRHDVTDPVAEAERHFLRLGMQRTRERNAVLLYFAPRSRKFAIVGDVGVHEKCGHLFWRETAADIEAHLKQSRYTDALVAGISKVGAVLAAHFPRQPDDKNELPDEVAGD